MYQSSRPRSFSDQLNEWVQQPIFFAAIASLGLHGVLFAALPSFSPTPISDDSQRTVPVVELDTEDISRLPSFVDLDTPSVPQPVIPYDPYEFDSSLDSDDGLDSLEQLLDDFDTNSPSSPSSDDFLIPQPTPLPSPISPPSPLSSSWPFALPRPNPRPTPIPPPTPVSPQATPIPVPNSNESNSNESNSSELDNNQLGNNESDNNESDSTPSQDSSDAEDSGTTSTESEVGSNQAAAPPTTEPAPSASLEETQTSLAELFQYTGPTDNEALEKAIATATENWNKLIVERPDITATDESYGISITAEYPKFACLLQTDDIRVIIAVFVDATNQILETPEPIYIFRSWRQWFDDEALKLIKAYEFDNPTGMTTSYAVTVTFDYEPEKCPLVPSAPSSTTGAEVPSQPDAIPNPVSPSPDSAAPDSAAPDSAETSGSAEIPAASEPSDSSGTNDSSETTDPAGTADPSTTIEQDLPEPNAPNSADSEMTTSESAEDAATGDEDATAPANETQSGE